MAEFVQLRLEEMRPELEQYVKFQLFKPDDIRCVGTGNEKCLSIFISILSRNMTIQRKELEYKIHKHSKSKDDYLKYIQYEVDLLKLLRLKLEV
jgi:U3 small nucleolar RNA-associated protein 6